MIGLVKWLLVLWLCKTTTRHLDQKFSLSVNLPKEFSERFSLYFTILFIFAAPRKYLLIWTGVLSLIGHRENVFVSVRPVLET